MSPIGRIFSVLNLILAALFLSWASNNLATSHEYKKQLEDANAAHEKVVDELNGRITLQTGEIDNLKTLLEDQRDKASSAEDAKRRIEIEKSELTQQNQQLSATNDKNATTISDFESHIGALESAKDQAVAAQHDAENQRDEALAGEQEAKTNEEEVKQENARLLDQIADLEKDKNTLEAQVAKLDVELQTLIDVTGVNVKDVLAQKLIKGAVLQVNNSIAPGLVALNVGSIDEVKRGYTFEIFNGGQYKGQIRIENVRENMCTGLITKLYDGQSIQQGDQAATRL